MSVEELLYAATLTNDNARKEAIFTKTTQLYPNDFRAYNNLGELAFAAGDAAKANLTSNKLLLRMLTLLSKRKPWSLRIG